MSNAQNANLPKLTGEQSIYLIARIVDLRKTMDVYQMMIEHAVRLKSSDFMLN